MSLWSEGLWLSKKVSNENMVARLFRNFRDGFVVLMDDWLSNDNRVPLGVGCIRNARWQIRPLTLSVRSNIVLKERGDDPPPFWLISLRHGHEYYANHTRDWHNFSTKCNHPPDPDAINQQCSALERLQGNSGMDITLEFVILEEGLCHGLGAIRIEVSIYGQTLVE